MVQPVGAKIGREAGSITLVLNYCVSVCVYVCVSLQIHHISDDGDVRSELAFVALYYFRASHKTINIINHL